MLKSMKFARRLSFCRRLQVSSQPRSSEAIAEADKWTDFVKTLQADISPLPLHVLKEISKENRVFELINDKMYSPDDLISILQGYSAEKASECSFPLLEKISAVEQIEALPVDYCLDVMMFLIKLKLQETELYEYVCHKLENTEEILLNPGKAIICIAEAKNRQIRIPAGLERAFYVGISKQCSHLKISELLTAFNHLTSPNLLPDLVQHAKSLLNIMSCAEAIALFKHLSNRRVYDKEFFRSIAQKIVLNNDPLSINQVVTLAFSASNSKIRDTRLWRKIVANLQTEVIHMTWNDATSLIESFRKRRLGDREAWDCFSKWVNTHIEDVGQLSLKAITIVTYAFVNLGVEGSETMAHLLLKALSRPKARTLVSSQRDWLMAVHTLAMNDSLPQEIGETVLGKEFVDELLKSSNNIYQEISNARKLLQVQACLLQKYGEAYTGPRIAKSTFGTLLTTKEAIEAMQMEKYGQKSSNINADVFDTGINLVIPKSHVDVARVDERGYFWDAAVALDQNNRCVPKNIWTDDTCLQPIIIFDWKQIKESLHLSVSRPTESNLMGEDRMMLKHLRGAGLKPFIVFTSDIIACGSGEDKNRMEILSFEKDEGGALRQTTLINEPLSKIGAAYQGRCRIYILFMQSLERLPNIGLVSIKLKNIRDLPLDRLMESPNEDALSTLVNRGVTPNEFLIIDLIFFEKPFRLNFRLRIMANDRTYSGWSPFFQSEIPLCSRLLVEIPKQQCRIYNAENFHLFLYDFLDITRRPAVSCGICLDENNVDKFISYKCGHGMCTSCETQHASARCCICNTNKEWKLSVRRRESACPIDNCAAHLEEHVFYPCGCIIAHIFKSDENPKSLIGTRCPYKLCQIQIRQVIKIYIT